ncbi:MAG: type IV pilus modification protein PilV [Burkholderiaceae bacterium]
MTMNSYAKFYRRLQAGLSMIEVLVSLTIVAFGVLGLLGLQARALSFQRDSFDRRTAAEMVAQLAERMRANHLGVTSGLYSFPAAPYLNAATATPPAIPPCVTPTACTMNELALRDWTQWRVEYRQRSPGAAAYLQWNAADPRAVTMSVAWPEPQQTSGVADPICAEITLRLGLGAGVIPANYRCFTTAVFP